MSWVVDASVAMKWLVSEDHSDIADRVLASSNELHAPRLMASEITNAISRKARLGEIGRDLATALAASVSNLPVLWHCDEELCANACGFAMELDTPVYDCVYLALGYRVGASVLTVDFRFINTLRATEHRGMAVSIIDFR